MAKGYCASGRKLRHKLILQKSRMPTASTIAYSKRKVYLPSGYSAPESGVGAGALIGRVYSPLSSSTSHSHAKLNTLPKASTVAVETHVNDMNLPLPATIKLANGSMITSPLQPLSTTIVKYDKLSSDINSDYLKEQIRTNSRSSKNKFRLLKLYPNRSSTTILSQLRTSQNPEMARYDTNDFNVKMYHTAPPSRKVCVQVEFEVSGGIHGVYFTRYAKEMSQKLRIRGWIRFTKRGTIEGQVEGEKDQIDEMAMWLKLQGSPGSKIDSCKFKRWQIIDSYSFRDFSIRF